MKRLTRLGGALIGIGAAAVGVVWLIKDKITGTPQIPVDEPAPFRVPPAETAAAPAEADDLSEISGIGPVYRARLTEAGITTFSALADAGAEAVAEAAGVGIDRATDWIGQAAAATTG